MLVFSQILSRQSFLDITVSYTAPLVVHLLLKGKTTSEIGLGSPCLESEQANSLLDLLFQSISFYKRDRL